MFISWHMYMSPFCLGILRIGNKGVLSKLGIPHSKQHEFRQQSNTEGEAVSKCIEWWLHNFTLSWRDIIYKLDKAGDMKLADGMRKYAEPQKGTSYRHALVRSLLSLCSVLLALGVLYISSALSVASNLPRRLYFPKSPCYGLRPHVVDYDTQKITCECFQYY